MRRFLTLIISFIVMITTVTLRGQQPPSTESAKAQVKAESKGQAPPKTKTDELAKEKEKTKTSTDEEAVITHHQIHIDGKELAYTATTGLMPLKDTKGEVEARIFFVAYTRNEAGPVAAASAHVQFQWRAGISVGVAAFGSTGSTKGRFT